MAEEIVEGISAEVFKHQADATLDQTDPVSGTKYEVLATTKNVRIILIEAQCTWTVQPTPLEIHVTIDGQPLVFSKADPVSEDYYYATPYAPVAGGSLNVVAEVRHRAFLLEGRSVKVEAEITGGTVSNLSARVKYAKIP
ncbi:MAG: hypothetical protein HWN68_15215 [Desulfobacterales bacterium]|nr:hypothetical protein [Desulfobacterales bacterium]